MNLFGETWAWLTSPASWSEGGIPARIGEHLTVTLIAVSIAAVIAVPLGVLIGHRRRGGGWFVASAGAARAIPTLGLLTLFALALGIGLVAPVLVLVILAIPPLLAGAHAGVAAIDNSVSEAARAIGMSEAQIVLTVEVPLAARSVLGGVRSATLQVVATATLAAYVSDSGLGRFIMTGLKSRDYAEMLGGSALVAAMALLLDALFVVLLRSTTRRTASLTAPPERTP